MTSIGPCTVVLDKAWWLPPAADLSEGGRDHDAPDHTVGEVEIVVVDSEHADTAVGDVDAMIQSLGERRRTAAAAATAAVCYLLRAVRPRTVCTHVATGAHSRNEFNLRCPLRCVCAWCGDRIGCAERRRDAREGVDISGSIPTRAVRAAAASEASRVSHEGALGASVAGALRALIIRHVDEAYARSCTWHHRHTQSRAVTASPSRWRTPRLALGRRVPIATRA